MPNVKTHDFLTFVFSPIVALITYLFFSKDLSYIVILVLSFLFGGLMFSGDLDIKSRVYKRWGVFKFIWYPYRKLVRHRSYISHNILTGPIFRLAYFILIIFILFSLILILSFFLHNTLYLNLMKETKSIYNFILSININYFITGFIGLFLGCALHSIADIISSFLKKLIVLLILFQIFNTVSYAADFEEYYKKGLLLLQNSKYEEALKEFQNALIYEPNNPDILFGIGVCFFKLKLYTEAYKAYDKALFYYSPQLKVNAISGLGDIYLELGYYDEAIKYYKLVIEQKPEWLGIHLNLAKAYSKIKEYDKALEKIDYVLSINQNIQDAYMLKSLIYLEQSKFNLALNELEKAKAVNSNISPILYYQLNRLYRLNNKYPEAINIIKDLINNIKDISIIKEAPDLLGDTLLEYQDFILNKKILTNELPYFDNTIFKESLNNFKKAALISPANADIRYKIGQVYYWLGEYKDAINYLKQAIILDKNDFKKFSLLCENLWLNFELNEAEKIAKGLIKNFPNKADSWITVFKINKAIGQYNSNKILQQGLKLISKKYKNINEEIKLKFCLGEDLFLEGDITNANKLWEDVRIKAPKSIYTTLIKAYTNFEKKNYNEALNLLNEIQEINPFLVNIYTLKGLIYLSINNYEKAIHEFEWACFLDKIDIKNYYYLGLAYLGIKNSNKAKELFKYILKINVNNQNAQYYFLKSIEMM